MEGGVSSLLWVSRIVVLTNTDTSSTHVMEVTAKVEVKLFCDVPRLNAAQLYMDDMEPAVSLAQGYE